ncbi:MAG: hypothetical protein CO108_27720 [Deltaproteobacteria bacterium CG_4_9_14_3_um_filter_63_12]|nr:MAG: hypothetical protein CO108_27720 [Deltaproteobacteria bacterium CG_4_9_14_3_um_filter_63_12]
MNVNWRRWIGLLSVVLLGLSCNEPLDFERQEVARGTFGEEVFRILHKDLQRSPLEGKTRAEVFEAHKADFTAAIDAIFPDAQLDAIDQLMLRMMPFYDSELIPGLVRKLAVVLDEMATDEPLLEAFARIGARPSLLQDPAQARALALVFDFQRLQELSDLLTAGLLAHDGLPAGESDATLRLVASAAEFLSESELTGDPNRFSVTLMNLLTTDDPAFEPAASYTPIFVVKVDSRGLPMVKLNDLGDIPPPFADLDGDDLADVDSLDRFVGLDGSLLQADAFGSPGVTASGGMSYDAAGQLFNPNAAQAAFEVVDLHRTLLGTLMRDAGELSRADVPLDLLRSLEVVLGPTQRVDSAGGSYDAYLPDSDLVALSVGLLVALDRDDVPAVLEGVLKLLEEHPNELAAVLHALDKAIDVVDAHPETDFSDTSNLLDEMLPLVLELVETPGLLQELLVAMDSPAAREAGPVIAWLMQHKKEFVTVTPGGAYDTCFHTCKGAHELGTVDRIHCIQACPRDEIFDGTVDLTAPETPQNVSLFERTQALMWETTNWPYEVGIQQLVVNGFDFTATAQAMGPVLVFDDLAKSYLLSVTGDLHLTEMINPDVANLASPLGLDGATVTDVVLWINQNILGVTMDADPTPDQVSRFFNTAPLESIEPSIQASMNVSMCRSGRRCIDANADMLLAIEAAGMVDVLHPLVQVFTAHGKTDLLARMFVVLYSHYPSRGTVLTDAAGLALPLVRSNIRSLEGALIELLNDGAFLDALAALGPILAQTRVGAANELFMTVNERFFGALLTPDSTLRTVKGLDRVPDPFGHIVTPLSPVYLLLDPLRAVDNTLSADQAAKDAWDRATTALYDLMLETVDDGNGTVRFAKPGGIVLARLATEALRDTWMRKDAAGTRSEWLRQTLAQDLKDFLAGRGLRASVELFQWFDAQPTGPDMIREAALHLLEAQSLEVEADAQVSSQATLMVYQLLATGLDERSMLDLGRFLSRVIDPRRLWDVAGYTALPLVSHGLQLLSESSAVDPDGVLLDLIGRAVQTGPDGTTQAGQIWQVLKTLNRVEPGSDATFTAADGRRIAELTRDFLRDDQRGLERLYGFIETAMYGPAGKQE